MPGGVGGKAREGLPIPILPAAILLWLAGSLARLHSALMVQPQEPDEIAQSGNC